MFGSNIFFLVRIKLMCLGLHRIIVNNGTKDNIVIDKVLVQGLGWELYFARCLHTIRNIEESQFDK